MPASTWAVRFFSSIHNIRFWKKARGKKTSHKIVKVFYQEIKSRLVIQTCDREKKQREREKSKGRRETEGKRDKEGQKRARVRF